LGGHSGAPSGARLRVKLTREMKRSPALAPLSRDHQHALDAALRLRRAGPESVDEAVAHFQRFFEREGRRHFAIEERLLLPALPAGDDEWAPCVRRVRADHDAIRAGAGAIGPGASGAADVAAARSLGERLAGHVRFEERVAFEMLERRLPAPELARLGAALAAAEGDAGPG
jgi:hemerythrin HHE cation binding domain-containing protein